MEQYGNEHFNVERVLRENINGHEYMRRTARELSSWDSVVDEIYRTVDHVEPWMSGNVRGPSTAFCLLYRLFELKLTEDEIHQTIICKDSPYIRAIGFLYLRYVGDPKELLSWFQPFFNDTERFWPSGEGYGREVTISEYACDLLLCQNYFETIFTRIPKKVGDDIVSELKSSGLPHVAVGNGGQGGPDRRGTDDGRARPASVKASLSVAMGQRAPNRAGVTEDVSQRLHRREDLVSSRDKDRWGAASREREKEYDKDRERDRVHRNASNGRRERHSDWERHGDRGAHPDHGRHASDRGAHNGSSRDYRADRPPRDRARDGRDRNIGRSSGAEANRYRDSRERDRDDERGGTRSRDRASAASVVFGRSAAEVFGKSCTQTVRYHSEGDVDNFPRKRDMDDVVKIGRRR